MAKRKYNGMSRHAMQRAVKIFQSGSDMIKCVNKSTWKVKSQSEPKKWHTVKINESELKCTCAYWQNHKESMCVHGLAIKMYILQNTLLIKPSDKKVRKDNVMPRYCPKGHTSHITRAGTKKRKYRDPTQIYECHECKSRFAWDEIGFVGIHYPPYAVLLVLCLYDAGNSPETVSLALQTNMDISVHETTVERWSKRFCK